MKEFHIYLKERPLNLSVPITNLTFTDRLSIRNDIMLRETLYSTNVRKLERTNNRMVLSSMVNMGQKTSMLKLLSPMVLSSEATGVHCAFPYSLFTQIGILSEATGIHNVLPEHPSSQIELLSDIGVGLKTDLMSILAATPILTDADERKISLLHADSSDLCIFTSGGTTILSYAFPEETHKIGLIYDLGSATKVESEKVNEQIGIIAGRYRLLNEFDDSELGSMDGEELKFLDAYQGLVIHEVNHESADTSVVLTCAGIDRSIIYPAVQEEKIEVRAESAYAYIARHRFLSEVDDISLSDIDEDSLDDINYITF